MHEKYKYTYSGAEPFDFTDFDLGVFFLADLIFGSETDFLLVILLFRFPLYLNNNG